MTADTSSAPSALQFPRETFAVLSPGPFLLAHLKPASSRTEPSRPSGRTPLEFRQPKINAGSLSHCAGSAVVRAGDTAVVCGVRAEILLASDIPQPHRSIDLGTSPSGKEIQDLGLLVPNVELSTGCSPQHLPGNPPSTQAQSLSHRVLSLLHMSDLLSTEDLRITYKEPATDEEDTEPRTVTKAYWTLYIDTLVMSLDGNAFDTVWGAVVAALRDVRLPNAKWDADREAVVCSPLASDAKNLQLRGLPIAASFGVFSTQSHMKSRDEAESWVLADLDEFEEGLCKETVTIAVRAQTHGARGGLVRVEKNGGGVVDAKRMRELVDLAKDRWSDWEGALRQGDT